MATDPTPSVPSSPIVLDICHTSCHACLHTQVRVQKSLKFFKHIHECVCLHTQTYTSPRLVACRKTRANRPTLVASLLVHSSAWKHWSIVSAAFAVLLHVTAHNWLLLCNVDAFASCCFAIHGCCLHWLLLYTIHCCCLHWLPSILFAILLAPVATIEWCSSAHCTRPFTAAADTLMYSC